MADEAAVRVMAAMELRQAIPAVYHGIRVPQSRFLAGVTPAFRYFGVQHKEMNMRRGTGVAVGGGMLLLAQVVCGQTIQLLRVDNGSTRHRAEVALEVCRTTKEVLVAWHENVQQSPLQVRVFYNVSTNGQSFRSDPGPIPNTGFASDPMVACSQLGVGSIGAYNGNASPPHFWIGTKNPSAGYIDPDTVMYVGESGANVDKGVLAWGPPSGGGADFLRLTYKRYDGHHRLRGMNSPPSTPFAVGQFGQSEGGNEGAPNSSLVIRTSSIMDLIGDWVVAYYTALPTPLPPQLPAPPEPQVTRFTGANWEDSVNPTEARRPLHLDTEPIAWFLPTESIIPVGGPYVFNTPSIAADPRDEKTIYMAFLGRTVSTGLNKIDLFIARSEDGGADFSGSGANVLHLRDVEDLADAAGAIQFLPAITVDAFGVIHVFYQVASGTGATKYSAKQVSISQFSTLPASWPVVNVRNIADAHEMTGVEQVELRDGRIFFGDYTMADSLGCDLYYGFVSRHQLGPSVGTYVAHVNMCIDADSDHDGAVTSTDPAVFTNYFVLNDPRADLNHNSLFEAGDVSRFLESYACACNP